MAGDIVNISGHASNSFSQAPNQPSTTGNEQNRQVSPPTREDGSPKEPQSSNLSPTDRLSFSPEAKEIQKLQARDREVKAHEAAHAAAGAGIAGSPSYTYQVGPDGRRYAVGGEVPIDVSPVPGDPEATIAKAQQIRAAALAPAQPSSADRAIAAQASQMAANARAELAQQKMDEAEETGGVASQEEPPFDMLNRPNPQEGYQPFSTVI